MKIDPFPGVLTAQFVDRPFTTKTGMAGCQRVKAWVLTDEQRAWLADVYPATENERIAKAMGISKETVRVQARKIGLEKSETGMKAIRKRQQRQAAKTNEANGCYDRKRGHPPSQATLNGTRQRWREINAGLREHPMVTFRKRHPKKYKEVMERKRQDRINLIQKEKRRIIYGLERKTTLEYLLSRFSARPVGLLSVRIFT